MNTTQKIQATTITLLGKNGLLDGKKSYVIPVYQRPYSWEKEQIRRLFQTLITNFRSEDGEESFLGTVLLMPPSNEENQVWEVVDGQQRLTTFYFFFHYLIKKGKGHLLPRVLHSEDWLRSVINGGEEQKAMKDALKLSLEDIQKERNANDNNRYAYRLFLIQQEFEDLWDDAFQALEGEEQTEAKKAELMSDAVLTRFIAYICRRVTMVQISSQTGLAKTLAIFDTINTTGMALNGGDIFKIRMYEYLKDVKGLSEEDDPFKQIDALYKLLEVRNKEHQDWHPTHPDRILDMEELLSYYQRVLIERQGISRETHGLASSTFWDRAFRAILFKEQIQSFQVQKFRNHIELADLTRLLEARFQFERPEVTTLRSQYAIQLIHLTRYGWRFWWIAVLYLYQFRTSETENSFDCLKFERFVVLMTNYYAIQSIRFAKVVNASITFTYGVIKAILGTNDPDVVIQMVEAEIQYFDPEHLRSWLSEPIYGNYKHCKLICMLAVMTEPDISLETDATLHDEIFNAQWGWDMDHILAQAAFERLDDHLKSEWEPLLHTLGNLTMLERTVNQSQSDAAFEDKRVNLTGSMVNTARSIGINEAWTPEICAVRRDTLAKRITDFLIGKSTIH